MSKYEATIKLNNITIKVGSDTWKGIFEEIAGAHEVFGEKECGLCHCKDIKPIQRKTKKVTGKKVEVYNYAEYVCQNSECRARLTLTPLYDDPDRIFPCRTLIPDGPEKGKPNCENGKYGPHNGWTKYRGHAQDSPTVEE